MCYEALVLNETSMMNISAYNFSTIFHCGKNISLRRELQETAVSADEGQSLKERLPELMQTERANRMSYWIYTIVSSIRFCSSSISNARMLTM